MKILKILKFLVLFSIIGGGDLFSQIKNSIIAKVGIEIITSLDVENEIKTILLLTNSEISQKNIDEARKTAIQTLVSKSIKKIEINKYKVKAYSEVDLNKYLQGVSAQLNVEKDQLKKLLNSNEIDYNSFVDSYKTELLWNTLIYKVYNSNLSLNPIEIENIIYL